VSVAGLFISVLIAEKENRSTNIMSNGIGSHTLPNNGLTNTWITPKYITDALGSFDLDPCAHTDMPYSLAKNNYTINDDGLKQEWTGRVWMNPPYGRETAHWLKKLSEHNNGTALVFARTETKMFFRWVWPYASAILFFDGRLFFYDENGNKASGNAGGPSCLIAYGENDAIRLQESGLKGKFIKL
jgi:hypothetical protein